MGHWTATDTVCLLRSHMKDHIWLAKPNNSNCKIICLYSYCLFDGFICVQFCKWMVVICTEGEAQHIPCFLANNFLKQVPFLQEFKDSYKAEGN